MENGNSKNEPKTQGRKRQLECRPQLSRLDGATIPPLRNGQRRRCSGRDDSIEKARVRRGRENRAAPFGMTGLDGGARAMGFGYDAS
jgi:hypothetical protein